MGKIIKDIFASLPILNLQKVAMKYSISLNSKYMGKIIRGYFCQSAYFEFAKICNEIFHLTKFIIYGKNNQRIFLPVCQFRICKNLQ